MSGGGNIISWSISHYCSPPAKWEIIAAVGGAYLGCDHQHTVSPWSPGPSWPEPGPGTGETLPSEGWPGSILHSSNCDIDVLLTMFSFSLKKARIRAFKESIRSLIIVIDEKIKEYYLNETLHQWMFCGRQGGTMFVQISTHIIVCQKCGPLLNAG